MYAKAKIVESIIGDLLFCVVEGEDGLEEVSKAVALRHFKKRPAIMPGRGDRFTARVRKKLDSDLLSEM